jgi:hypothetical protein
MIDRAADLSVSLGNINQYQLLLFFAVKPKLQSNNPFELPLLELSSVYHFPHFNPASNPRGIHPGSSLGKPRWIPGGFQVASKEGKRWERNIKSRQE